MPDSNEISEKFEQLLRDVNHARTSTTKYREFERYLAELLGIQAADIYTSHVAKSGNFDVRMSQSKRARNAHLWVALLRRDVSVDSMTGVASRIARDRNPGNAVLLIRDIPGGWKPQWGIESAGDDLLSDRPGHLSRFRLWFEDFELHTYRQKPPQRPNTDREESTTDGEREERISIDLTEQAEQMLRDLSARPEVTELLYRLEPDLFSGLIENDVRARDVVAIAHRRAVVDRFRRLLNDPPFFSKEAEPFGEKKEKVWQNLLEKNPWILGVSLAGQLLTSWNKDKLEQVVAGFSIAKPGKRSDAVMHTNGRIRAMVFAEIKHHDTQLLSGIEYRTGSWAPSSQLSGGVVQAQQTVHLASSEIRGRLSEKDDSGADTGEHTYMVRPRSFLILGNLAQLRGQKGVHRSKYESFELYRRNLYEPEIITFDELLARAEWHVEIHRKDRES